MGMQRFIGLHKRYTVWHGLLVLLFVYFFWLMLRLTLDYVPYSANVAFLMIKQTEVTTHPEYLYIFYTHVYTSIFVLLFGFVQFFSFSSTTGRRLHRWSGYGYAGLLLFMAAPSGLYMAFHANGGTAAVVSFVVLSLLWWGTTFMAMRSIWQRDFTKHRNFMLRSYALCLSAVMLRLWKVVLVYLFYLPPMDTYKIIAWLGWVPNIIIAELIIYYKYQPLRLKP